MSIPKLKSLIEQPVKKITKISGVVLKSEGEVLLTKRSEVAGKYPNFWAVPMGHVEKGEKFKEAAAREFKEETMLDIDSNSLVYLSMLKDSNYNRALGQIFGAYAMTINPASASASASAITDD